MPLCGPDRAAGLARHQAHGEHVVAAGRGGEPPGDDRAGLGGEGEQAEQHPGLGLVEHPVVRAGLAGTGRGPRSAWRSAAWRRASSALTAGLFLAGCGTPGVGALPRRNRVTEMSTPGASHQVARVEIWSASSCAPPRCRAVRRLNAAVMSACAAGSSGVPNTHSAR